MKLRLTPVEYLIRDVIARRQKGVAYYYSYNVTSPGAARLLADGWGMTISNIQLGNMRPGVGAAVDCRSDMDRTLLSGYTHSQDGLIALRCLSSGFAFSISNFSVELSQSLRSRSSPRHPNIIPRPSKSHSQPSLVSQTSSTVPSSALKAASLPEKHLTRRRRH